MNDDSQFNRPQNPLPDDLPPEFREDLTLPPSTPKDRRGAAQMPPADDWGQEPYEEPTGSSGPGCLLWGVVVVVLLLIGVMVVGMAGAAGWTEGRRVADRNLQATGVAFAERQLPAIATNVADLNDVQLATRIAFLATRTPGVPQMAELQTTATAVRADINATQEAVIVEQLTAIPDAIAQGDTAQVQQRLDFLMTQTPGVPQVPELAAAATMLAERPPEEIVEVQPQETPAAQETVDETSPDEDLITAPVTGDDGVPQFDLPALLAQAQQLINADQLSDATRTLDLIMRVDPDFQPQTVQRLMFDSLRQQAQRAYQISLTNPRETGTLAEAVRLTNQAELYGTPGQLGDLLYERDVALLYLSAVSAIEASNFPLAIQRLERIRALQTEYKGVNINRLIFDQYVGYGDALMQFDREYCRAEQQYNAALTFFADANVSGKRDNARVQCQQAQLPPTQPPELPDGEQPVAPIGVPGT